MSASDRPRSVSAGAFPYARMKALIPGDLKALQQRLGHRFSDETLLVHALTHPSAAPELGRHVSNQRLEYLGDAVLQLLVGRCLYDDYPMLDEGPLSRMRVAAVSEPPLAGLARRLALGECLAMGVGAARNGGRELDSVLSDAMEAVVAALYLDGGMPVVEQCILPHLKGLVASELEKAMAPDPKTALQERLQVNGDVQITYTTIDSTGPDHAKTFVVEVAVNGRALAQGKGRSKRAAQKEAAQAALTQIDRGSDPFQ